MANDRRFENLELDWGDRKPRGSDAPEPSHEPPPGQPGPAPRHGGAPGDPHQMSDNLQLLLAPLFTGRQLRVRQFREHLEILTGWHQANRYEVSGEDGRPIFWAAEQANGLLGSLSRNFNPFYKNTTECLTVDGTVAMRVTFPFAFFFRRGEVTAWDGRPLGRTQQRFHLLRTRIDLVGMNDNVLLEISGPMFKFLSFTPWVFEVKQHGRVVANIRKHWSGWFQELFTRADNFTIDFEPGFTDPRLRQLLVAAALTIDLVNFEQPDQSRGSLLGKLLE